MSFVLLFLYRRDTVGKKEANKQRRKEGSKEERKPTKREETKQINSFSFGSPLLNFPVVSAVHKKPSPFSEFFQGACPHFVS